MKQIAACLVKTPAGELVVAEESGRLAFCCFRDRFAAEAKDLGYSPLAPSPKPKTVFLKKLKAKVERYFDGELTALSGVPLKLRGTEFQQKVWRELARIEPGTVKSYAQVARRISRGGASRAVGSACGKNPFLLFVPCHRVVATGGGLGGFSAGLKRKERLLAHEGKDCS